MTVVRLLFEPLITLHGFTRKLPLKNPEYAPGISSEFVGEGLVDHTVNVLLERQFKLQLTVLLEYFDLTVFQCLGVVANVSFLLLTLCPVPI